MKNPKTKTQENLVLEDLQCGGLKILQDHSHYCFTSDSVILANFISTKKDAVAVEIGAGCGVISILAQAKTRLKKVFAFELQPSLAEICQKNIKINHLEDKICVFCDDIKNFERHLPKESADVVFCNPPYFLPTNFPQTQEKKLAKEEVMLSCQELCEVAVKILKNGGNFFVCYAAERTPELFFQLQKNNLAVKEFFFTQNGKNKMTIVVVKATKNGKIGSKLLPILQTNQEDGTFKSALHTKNFL